MKSRVGVCRSSVVLASTVVVLLGCGTAAQGDHEAEAPAPAAPATSPEHDSHHVADAGPEEASAVATPGSENASERSDDLVRAAYKAARPVFETHCARCHTSAADYRKKDKALKHFSMDAYPFGGHHAHELGTTIRNVLGASGKKATMPLDEPGAVKGKELALVFAWADAFDAAGGADGHKHGHKDTPKKPTRAKDKSDGQKADHHH